jgi:hypothetical protein
MSRSDAEAPIDPADLVVQLFVAVETYRDDRLRRPSSRDPLDTADDAIALKAVGRELQKCQAPPACHEGVENLVDVRSEKNFPSGQIGLCDVRVLADDGDDLVGGQLV